MKVEDSPYNSLFIEFDYLSDLTGNEKYRDVVNRALQLSKTAATTNQLKPTSWSRHSVQTTEFGADIDVNWNLKLVEQAGGALYDYILKKLISGYGSEISTSDLRNTYIRLVDQATQELFITSKKGYFHSKIILDGKIKEEMVMSDCYVGKHRAFSMIDFFVVVVDIL